MSPVHQRSLTKSRLKLAFTIPTINVCSLFESDEALLEHWR